MVRRLGRLIELAALHVNQRSVVRPAPLGGIQLGGHGIRTDRLVVKQISVIRHGERAHDIGTCRRSPRQSIRRLDLFDEGWRTARQTRQGRESSCGGPRPQTKNNRSGAEQHDDADRTQREPPP
jgi:hypothetical protein